MDSAQTKQKTKRDPFGCWYDYIYIYVWKVDEITNLLGGYPFCGEIGPVGKPEGTF